MHEVLSLTYSPGAGLLVKVASVKESAHNPGVMIRQLGVPEPQATIAIDSLPEPHRSAFRALLVELVPLVDASHAADAADPVKLAEAASALAAERHAHEADRKEREEEKARLDAEIAKKRADAAAEAKELDDALAAKRAEAKATRAE